MPRKATQGRSSAHAVAKRSKAASTKRAPAAAAVHMVAGRKCRTIFLEMDAALLQELDAHVARLRAEYFSSTLTQQEVRRAATIASMRGMGSAQRYVADCRRKRKATQLPGAPLRMPSRTQLMHYVLQLGLKQFAIDEEKRAVVQTIKVAQEQNQRAIDEDAYNLGRSTTA